jgi:carbonic anhydrase
MNTIKEILKFNDAFVRNKQYEPYKTTKFPDKKMVILSCMDTRLTELLPRALNIKNGDAKLIKNAGAVITHPFGSIMRSIIVAIYELNATEVCVIGHHGCGMNTINPSKMLDKFIQRGVSKDTISTLEYSGIHLETWLYGFDQVDDSVKASVNLIKNHPLIPKDVPIHGLVIDPENGKLDLIVDGYENL